MSNLRLDAGGSKRKQRLSSPLMALPGVVGVGQSDRTLQIYLANDSDETRRQVADVVESVAPGTAYLCVVSGPFRAG